MFSGFSYPARRARLTDTLRVLRDAGPEPRNGNPIMSHAQPQRGFTLVELMASISVLAVLAVAGLPSFTQLIARQRIDAFMQRLDTDLALARNTALVRRQPVIVCPRGADGTCEPGLDWSSGWVVLSEGSSQPGETLWVQSALVDPTNAIQVNATRPLLRYRHDGTSSGSNLSIRLCLNGQLQAQHIISNAGRVRRERTAGEIPCPT